MTTVDSAGASCAQAPAMNKHVRSVVGVIAFASFLVYGGIITYSGETLSDPINPYALAAALAFAACLVYGAISDAQRI